MSKGNGQIDCYYSKTILGEIWGESVPNSLEEAALAMNDPSHMTSVDLIVGLAGFPSLRRRRRDNDRPQNSHIVSSDDNKRACPRISHPGFAWFLRPLSWLSSGTGSEGLALLLTLWITILNRLNQVCIQVYCGPERVLQQQFDQSFPPGQSRTQMNLCLVISLLQKKNRPKNKGFCAKKIENHMQYLSRCSLNTRYSEKWPRRRRRSDWDVVCCCLAFVFKRPKDWTKMTDLSLTCTHNGDWNHNCSRWVEMVQQSHNEEFKKICFNMCGRDHVR